MFLGHYGVGFAAKRVAPRVSLGTLFLAAQWADLLWPILLLVGLERVRIEPGVTAVSPLDFTHYPITHSLLALAGWSVIFGLTYAWLRRYSFGAWVVGIAVISHWVLDLIVHRPDLPLFPGGPRVGLGLWNSPTWTVVVEAASFGLGLLLYLGSTTSKDRIGNIALWSLVFVLVAVYVADFLGPPPPNVQVLAITALAGWLLVLWAYWIDRHRSSRAATG